VPQLVVSVEVPPVLVELWWFLWTSSMAADSVLYHFGMQGSQLNDICKPLPGVFPSQPSPSDAQETQLHVSSLLGLQPEVLNELLSILYCGTQLPAGGYFRLIQDTAHVIHFQLYPTSLPSHSIRHVENLQEISCCFKKEVSAINSTI
jgi:hypothetical protein